MHVNKASQKILNRSPDRQNRSPARQDRRFSFGRRGGFSALTQSSGENLRTDLATDVPSQSPCTPNPSSSIPLSSGEKRGGVSPAVGSPDNRQSTKKPGCNMETPPSMKRGETRGEMLFEHQYGIEAVAVEMESLTATDDVKANLTSSVSLPPSCIISSIDELDHGDLILVKSGECKWYHGRVSDVDIGRDIIERYVKFDGDSEHVPLKNYSPADIKRQFPPSPSRRSSNAETTSTPSQVEVSSFSEETAGKTTEQASVPKASYRQRMAKIFHDNPFAEFVAMPRSPGGPSSWMKKLPPHFHATPKPVKLKSYDPRETDHKSSDTSPDKVDRREVESPLMQRQLEVDTDRKEESASDSDSSSNTEENEDDTDDLEAFGLTLMNQALLTDIISKVMSKRATNPEEVADFTLPSRFQPIEVRDTQGGSACFVACPDDASIKYSTTSKISFLDVRKKLSFRFSTLELSNACADDIERCIASTKTPYGQPNPVERDVMNAVIDMLGSHPAVVAYQVAHPLDELGYMMKLLDTIRKVDGCGGLYSPEGSTSTSYLYIAPCLCGHDECNKDIRYRNGTLPTEHFGLIHHSCALQYMNVRPGPSGGMIFDYPILGIYGELVNSDIGKIFFVTKTGDSCPKYNTPTSYAQLIPLLHGTTIESALVESSTEKREARASFHYQRYHSNLQDRREYNRTWKREAAAVRRALSWQDYLATTGDTTSMSEEQLNLRYQDVRQAVAKFEEEYGRYPFIQVCDAKEIENSLGQMVINRNEESRFIVCKGAPFKMPNGNHFSRSQLGHFGSSAEIEIEIGRKWALPSGRVSRDNETALILYCKEHFPGYTLNQREIAQDTDIMAKRKGWDNSNRINVLMLIDLLPALKNGSAKLHPNPVNHQADVKRLKKHHPSNFFL